MAKHQIEVAVPAQRVMNTDITVIVKSDDVKLGELKISKGTIDWKPARRRNAIRMRWETFARMMEDYE